MINPTLNFIKRKIKIADVQAPATFTVTLVLVPAGPGKFAVDARFNGDQNLLNNINQATNSDFLGSLKAAANTSMPYENFDDEDYLNTSGIKQFFDLEDASGKQIVQLVEDGYNLINEYVFDQPSPAADEPTPFIELIFQSSI